MVPQRRIVLGAMKIYLDIGLRIFVGVVFLTAGISKIPMQSEWVELMMAYKFLPPSLAYFYASVLPWLEITIGTCLTLGLFTRAFSLISIPIIISFIVANVWIVSLDPSGVCHCFGELVTIENRVALAIDVFLLIGALLIFSQRKHFITLDSLLTHFIRR